MKKENLISLLTRLGIQPIDINDGWVRVSCPLASTNHSSRSDRNPSAGFKINDTGPSPFHCFVCGTSSIESILNVFKWKYGVDLFVEYFQDEIYTEKGISFDKMFRLSEEYVHVPDDFMANFKPISYVGEYLTSRGIDVKVAESYGLVYCDRYMTADGLCWEKAILTPVKDFDFKTYWLHFRSVYGKKFWHGKSKNFGYDKEWGRPDSFFGMQWLNLAKPVILVEGAFDVLRLATLGLTNAIATHGGVGSSSKKLLRLKELNPVKVICGFDADEAGKKFTKAVRQVFGKIEELDWKIVGCKDAGELRSESDLRKVLNKRKLNFQDKWRIKAHEYI